MGNQSFNRVVDGLAAGSLVVALLVVYVVAPRATDGPKRHDNGILLVDEDGKYRLRLEIDSAKKEAVARVMDASGKKEVALTPAESLELTIRNRVEYRVLLKGQRSPGQKETGIFSGRDEHFTGKLDPEKLEARVDRYVFTSRLLKVRIISSAEKEPTSKLRLGVTPTQRGPGPSGQLEPWDDMGKLLDSLGKGYAHEMVTTDELLKNPEKIKDFDVLFLTCAGGGRELQSVLSNFVNRGGTLYASDWRFDALAAAFPDVVDKSKIGAGAAQKLEADIVDPGLREAVGPKIPLRFDLGDWKTAAFGGERVTILAQGTYRKQKSAQDSRALATAPLLVKFSFGRGTVIFTSFHNEKQNSDIEKKLLQYLVFSLVTAQVDYQVTSTITQDGFTPQKSNLLSSPEKNLAVTKEYTTQKSGSLRFALGFRNEGAKLRLTIESPDGKTFSGEFTSTTIVEVPMAPAGVWKYTIEALELPYENFPFTVTVGEKK